MDGKGDAAEAEGLDVAALARDLNRLLAAAANASPDEAERTARAVTAMVKAVQVVTGLTAEGEAGHPNEGLDAEGEQRLRDQFLGRLDALAAALELEGLVPCPACGRFEPDRERLERLAGSGADPPGG